MPRLRLPFIWLLVFLLAILLLQAGGRLAPLDEETVYRMTARLIEDGQVTLASDQYRDMPQTYPGFLPQSRPRTTDAVWTGVAVDGQRYPLYTHAQPLLQVPLYLIGRFIGGAPTNLEAVAITRFTTSLFNPIVVALTGWLIALFGSAWGFSKRLSAGLGLTYALGTIALAYTHTNFSDPLLALLCALAAYSSYRVGSARRLRWLLLTGLALGLALYLRERAFTVIPLFLGYVLLTRRARTWREWAVLLIPLGLGGAALAAWNMVRFGSPISIGYANWIPDTGFDVPILLGLYGLLISPGKGMLLYNPIAALGFVGLITLFHRHRAEAILFTSISAVTIGFYARYNFWTGGWNWGARYILVLLPFLLLAAGDWVTAHPTRFRKSLLIALSVLTLLLNLPAALVDHSRYLVSLGEQDPDHYLQRAILNVTDSPLTRQWPTALDLAALYARPETWQAARQAVQQYWQSYQGPDDFDALTTHLMWIDEFFRMNMPDFWFVHLPLLGFAPALVAALALGLLALALFSGWRVWQMFRSPQ
jgi:hypothetical protein